MKSKSRAHQQHEFYQKRERHRRLTRSPRRPRAPRRGGGAAGPAPALPWPPQSLQTPSSRRPPHRGRRGGLRDQQCFSESIVFDAVRNQVNRLNLTSINDRLIRIQAWAPWRQGRLLVKVTIEKNISWAGALPLGWQSTSIIASRTGVLPFSVCLLIVRPVTF